MGRTRTRVTVGYQDGCVHPLWLSRLNIRLARWFGASAIWLPDHFMSFTPRHVWQPEFTPGAKVVRSLDALFDPLQVLAVTARRVRGVDLGTSVTESLRRHPMSLAQSFVTLDHISKGRAILGIGNGIRENTEPYGIRYRQQVARLEEALVIIRKLWGSEGRPVSHDGKFWKLRDAVFDLPLYRGRPPRLFVAAHFPRMLRLAGRYGDGWLPGQRVDAEEYGRRLDLIREEARAAGRPMEDFLPTHTMLVAFGRTRKEVLEKAMRSRFCAAAALGAPAETWRAHGRSHPLGDEHGGFLELVPSRITVEQVEQAERTMSPEILETILYAGSPEEILAQVEPLADAGCRHFIIANMGAAFTGEGVRDLRRLRRLMHLLRRL